jgi:sugar-specific transcriptional regulator TrmB
MQQDLVKELQGIGLSDKEAKAYLAGLELGPATAQQIAAKATVNRPSAYIAIESLIKRGLMSSFQKGKKRYFNAGKPKQLQYILDQQKRQLEVQATVLQGILGRLETITGFHGESVEVQLYEGTEASHVIQDMLLNHSGEVFELVPLDEVRKFIPPKYEDGDVRNKFAGRLKIRAIYSENSPGNFIPSKAVEYRTVDSKNSLFKSEVLIFGNTVVMTTFDQVIKSVIIKNNLVADTMRVFFNGLWQSLK